MGQHLRSHTRNEYIMDIVDDYTSQLWSIPLKNKDDSFPELKAWDLAHESETSQKVGMYITDQGELKSNKMRDWLKSRGTDQCFTAPYTSAHIGPVERMHHTLMAKARTMRIYANCPPYPVLYSAPPIPVGLRSFRWNPVEWDRNPVDSTRFCWILLDSTGIRP